MKKTNRRRQFGPVAVMPIFNKKEILDFFDKTAKRIHKEYYSWILESDDINKINPEDLQFYGSIEDTKYDFKNYKKLMGERKDKARIIKVTIDSVE